MRRRVGGARDNNAAGGPARRNLTPGEILVRVEQSPMVIDAVKKLKGRVDGC